MTKRKKVGISCNVVLKMWALGQEFTYTFSNAFTERLHDEGGQEATHIHH